MKSTVILLVVLALIVGASYFESRYLTSKFEYFDMQLDAVIEDTLNEKDGSNKLQELMDWWKNEKQVLHAFVPHNEIRELDGIMAEAKTFIQNGEYDFAISKLKKLDDMIVSIPENYSFSFGNIF